MCKIKTISFDIGNTLIDLRGNGGFCQYFAMQTGLQLENLRPIFYEYFLTKNSSLRDAVEKVCYIIKYDNPEKIISEFRPNNGFLFDDVLQTLDELKRKNYHLIAVSNCSPWEALGYHELGLSDFINEVYYSFDIGYAKPDSRVFTFVQNKTNTLPINILHIGDSLKADIYGACDVGWNAMLLNRKAMNPTTLHKRYIEINSLNEILPLLEKADIE